MNDSRRRAPGAVVELGIEGLGKQCQRAGAHVTIKKRD